MRILFLDLDTLRPDHLGCYGYQRNTSPHIDSVAADGVRFDQYYCSDAPCLPSRTALMTGQFGIHTGVVGHGGTTADLRLEGPERGFMSRLSSESLVGILRQQGFHCTSISPFAERHGSWNFYAGFNEIHNTGGCGGESAEEISPLVMDWLQRNGTADNWFLHINYWDPHTPYRAPAEFGNPFADDPIPQWLTPEILAEHRQMVGPHGAREISMYDNQTDPNLPRQLGEVEDMEDLRHFFDGYDCGIRYMDDHIGRILQFLKDHDLYEDTAIIISSDHGENMGELGLYAEHATADAITCRIPMIIKWRGGRSGAVEGNLHYNLDLVPTLADLFHSQPAAAWDGQSYAPSITGHGEAAARPYLVLSQGAHVCQRGVRFERWMYIRTWHDGYHLFPDEMLFDLDADPHETTNLAEQHPDICAQASHLYQEWHSQMMASMPAGYTADPLWTVMEEGGPHHARGQLAAYCKYLEATGRGWAIPELQRRHPGEFN